MLEIRELGKRFEGLWALKNLSLQVGEGEVRAIIGPNGAGKSTLFKLIVGHHTPTEGDILYRGSSLLTLAADQRARKGIGIKFQITQVFESLSVFDNVRLSLMGPRSTLSDLFNSEVSAVEDEVASVLETVGLSDKADRPASSLVHGEKQWLEIGMVLATDPSLVLLDEPTSGMGPEETMQTAELIDRLKGDLTLIVVEHDMEFVKSVAENITVLHNGQLLAQGSYEEIRSDERVVDAYLGKGR